MVYLGKILKNYLNYMHSIEKKYDYSKCEKVLSRIKKSVAGGDSSTMRALPYQLPLVVEKTEGVYVLDKDGNRFIDMNMGYGPLIFGHKPSFIIDAVKREINKRGIVVGFPTELSYEVGELIKESFPSIEKMRFASSGTEVGQTAIRLARAFTGRSKIIIFEGHYHGSSNAVYHRYHCPENLLTERKPLPGTSGMEAPYEAILLEWNDLESLSEVIDDEGNNIAAIIMEPVMGNAGVIPPKKEYLKKVREMTQKNGILLIFDEVITGYRIACGGAQERFGVKSDLTMLSKAMNGGAPLSAIGGRNDIMNLLSDGNVFHGGVYSGNQFSLAATLAAQKKYHNEKKSIYKDLESNVLYLKKGIERAFDNSIHNIVVQNVGAMLSVCFINNKDISEINNYREILRFSNPEIYIKFQHRLQEKGVFIHPNQYEPWYLSIEHKKNIIDKVLNKIESVVKII